jgi:hypothetical protein
MIDLVSGAVKQDIPLAEVLKTTLPDPFNE